MNSISLIYSGESAYTLESPTAIFYPPIMGQNATAVSRVKSVGNAPISGNNSGNGGSSDGRAEMNRSSTVGGERSSRPNNRATRRTVGPNEFIGNQPPSLPPPTRHCKQQQAQDKVYSPSVRQPPLDYRAPPTTDEEKEDIEKALEQITNSFSPTHQRLLNIAIGKSTPHEELAIDLPSSAPLSSHHMHSMAAMVEMEFLESLKKELDHPEEKSVSDPNPFDLFLMQPSLFRPHTNLRQQLALCVPTKKKKGEQKKKMMWYDGQGLLWDLKPKTHSRKVSSLSGPVRIMEALTNGITPLMRLAMTREMIVDSDDVRMVTNTFCTANLNNSQQEAVATVSSSAFEEGLFCVLGGFTSHDYCPSLLIFALTIRVLTISILSYYFRSPWWVHFTCLSLLMFTLIIEVLTISIFHTLRHRKDTYNQCYDSSYW